MHTMLLVNSTEKIRLVLGKTIAPLFKERIGSGNMRDGFFCYLSCNGCSVLTFVG